MMNRIIRFFCLLIFFHGSWIHGQIDAYNFKRELTGISDQWHSITLPDDLFGDVANDLTDIRIFGISGEKDTVEAPYLLRLGIEKVTSKEVEFKLLNVAQNDKGRYFTFEIPTVEAINQIMLDFDERNFDWRVTLEGSQNQDDWFTLMENSRILSIKNEATDYQFTKLTFPSSKYRFFRLHVHNSEKVQLNSALISQREVTKGKYKDYPVRNFSVHDNKEFKQTEIEIELESPVKISHVKIEVIDTLDYYRPMTIMGFMDSVKTERGWEYNYFSLATATLNSMEENEFECKDRIVRGLKVIIHNHDNRPLKIASVNAKGYVHELIARFAEPGTYFLVYGNSKAHKPEYDISRFADKIPVQLTSLEVGPELSFHSKSLPKSAPLFENKYWLWGILAAIVMVLGWFALKMMKNVS